MKNYKPDSDWLMMRHRMSTYNCAVIYMYITTQATKFVSVSVIEQSELPVYNAIVFVSASATPASHDLRGQHNKYYKYTQFCHHSLLGAVRVKVCNIFGVSVLFIALVYYLQLLYITRLKICHSSLVAFQCNSHHLQTDTQGPEIDPQTATPEQASESIDKTGHSIPG